MTTKQRKTPTLFTRANGITFLRTVLLVLSMKYADTSMLLDMADGYVSRYYNESTLVGAVYDQLLDRMTSSYICFLNAVRYPKLVPALYATMVIDICGHWIHNYVCALYANTNHKEVDDATFLLRVYYKSKPLMFVSIVMYEIFFCSLYARSMYPVGTLIHKTFNALMCISAPLCLYKMLTNFLQGAYGCSRLLVYDRKLNE